MWSELVEVVQKAGLRLKEGETKVLAGTDTPTLSEEYGATSLRWVSADGQVEHGIEGTDCLQALGVALDRAGSSQASLEHRLSAADAAFFSCQDTLRNTSQPPADRIRATLQGPGMSL